MLVRRSRREFLASALTVAGATAMAVEPGRVLAYAGTYSAPVGAEGAPGRGQGIYLFEMNLATGALVERAVFPTPDNPSCLALNSSGTRLYAANETATYKGTPSGSVSAYEIERPSGQLKPINTVASEGAGPCHLSLHQSGKWLFVANYHGGTSAVLPIGANGELGAASDVERHDGVLGPGRAASAPPGSFAWSGHDRPHSHMILPDPSGRFVLAADLGLDRILIWKFDAAAGKLIPNEPRQWRWRRAMVYGTSRFIRCRHRDHGGAAAAQLGYRALFLALGLWCAWPRRPRLDRSLAGARPRGPLDRGGADRCGAAPKRSTYGQLLLSPTIIACWCASFGAQWGLSHRAWRAPG